MGKLKVNGDIEATGLVKSNAAGIYRKDHLTTEEQVNNFQAVDTLQYCTIGAEYTPIGNDGILICAGWSSGKYGAQIWIDDGGGSGGMKIRSFGKNNGAGWNDWQTVLTNLNYNSYAPSLTGAGASGNWNISAKNLYYTQELSTAELLDGFNETLRFKVGYWTNDLVPGCGNGIILNGGWTTATYGFQLAIDDDPTYFIALRQKNGGGWSEWKRIPMADGTGASGSWGISVTGKSGYTGDGDVNLIPGHSNELNFGGNYTSNSSIYFGFRQKDSRPVPTHYYFGEGGNGATVIAGTFQGNATSATTATTAETATYISDYGKPSAKIKIGLNGAGVTTTSYFAVYTTDGGYNAIKDMSVATVKSFLGIDDKLSKSGDTLNGTIVLGKNDDYGMYPDTNNYCQLGRNDHKFWKVFSTYGYFDVITTTQYGSGAPTSTSYAYGTLYFQT